MKKNLTIILLILLLLSIALPMVFYAEDPNFPPGEGSSTDPFIVTTAEQLYAVRSIWAGDIRLEADIVLNDETFLFQPDTGLVMVTDGANVGYLGTGTKGDASGSNTVFDTEASEAGVWYSSDTSTEKGEYTGEIRTWGGFSSDDYEDISIDGNGHTISGMYVNKEGNAGLFSTVWGSADITDLDIENAYVYGTEHVGGIAGYFDWGSIANCRFDGIVCGGDGTGYCGGIAGYCGNFATVQATDAHGRVLGGEGQAAGISASGKGSIRYCQNNATVIANEAAGIAGTSAEVYACINLGSIYGTENAAGIAWQADAILQSINSASVYGNNAYAITSEDTRAVEACYYNKDLFAGAEARATALLTNEMMKKESYPDLDFVYTWYIQEGASLPDYIFHQENDLSAALWDGSVADGFAAGDGSKDDPFIIQNAAQLAYLAKVVNEGISDFTDQFVRLDADIALNDHQKENWTTGAISWTPIGGTERKNKWGSLSFFGGTFDGNGHTISGLYIDSPTQNYVGLFGYFQRATIENLNIAHAFLRGNYGVATLSGGYNGGVVSGCTVSNATVIGMRNVGGLTGGGDLFNCTFDGSVYGFRTVGGVSADGNCQNCQNTENTTVTGFYQVGGIVGYGPLGNCDNYATVIGYSYAVGGVTGVGGLSDSRNYGSVSGNEGVGGIAGVCYGAVENCKNYGSVAGYENVGGIVGYQYYRPVLACHNLGTVSGKYNVGGILGFQAYDNVDYTLVAFCRNDGSVSGNAIVGGIVGYSRQSVQYCYNMGNVKGGLMVGGIIGNAEEALLNCFNIGNVRGDLMVGAMAGTVPQKSSGCYLQGSARLTNGEGCFAFGGSRYDKKSVTMEQFATNKLEDYGIPLDKYFILPANASRPYLYWELIPTDIPTPDGEFGGGNGSMEDPYRIENAEQLQLLSKLTNEGNTYKDTYFRLANDIVFAEGTAFAPIGKFEGHFDGSGHTISGLTIMGIDNVGLFSHNCGTITSITLTDSTVRGSINVGGIVGYNEGTVENCRNESTVIGYENVGGTVGRGGTVTECTNKGAISALYQYAGGIAGFGAVCTYCQNAGEVSASSYAGGIAGYASNLSYSQNSGSIGGTKYIGGIVGYATKLVEYCANSGHVSASMHAGGIAGQLSGGEIRYCINEGTVNASSDYAAGITAYVWNNPTLSYCINLGKVSATKSAAGVALSVYYPRGGTLVACYYVKGRVATHDGTPKAGLGGNDDKYGDYPWEVIGIEEQNISKTASYNTIPSFTEHFTMQSGRPVLRHVHAHVYDQQNTDSAFLVSAGSCTVPSTYYYSCSCGEAGEKTFSAHTTDNHNPIGEETDPHHKLCADCGQTVKVSEHAYTDEIVNGHYKACIHCGEKLSISGHSFWQKVVADEYLHTAANCKTHGRYYYSCTCGEKGERTFSHTVGDHTFGTDLYNDNDRGHFTKCIICGTHSDAQSHTYDEGVITIQPTEDQFGEMVYTCTECHYMHYEFMDCLESEPDPQTSKKKDKNSIAPYLIGVSIGAAVVALFSVSELIVKKKRKNETDT